MRYLLSLLLLLCQGALAQEFLDPAVAFKGSVRALDAQTLEVQYDIAKGYYLYKDNFKFKVLAPTDVTLGKAELPKGKEKQDETFGKVEVFYKTVKILLPVNGAGDAAKPLKLKLVSQGCAEAGICYPPHGQEVSVTLPPVSAAPVLATVAPAASGSEGKSASADESGWIAAHLQGSGFWTNLFFFFVAGLGLALTPCVFPMIPILSGIIVGQGHQVSRGRAFALSLAYVLGMAATYAAAGVAAGLTGTLLSAALQNAWVLGAFALVFVALSFSMFGFYELQLPTSLQSKLSEEAGHLQGGRGIGVFFMGALSALIVGPCVAAPLAGALLYIGQTGDALLGGAALFVMALGMGAPLLAVGLSAGTLLPRAGAWMEAVKKGFGVLLLATAVWLLSPVLPPVAVMLAYGVLLIVPAIYLHALDPLPAHGSGWLKFWKGVGIVMLITGAALLIGALSGSRDPLQPLAGLRGTAQAAEASHLPFQRVTSVADLETRVKAAGKPVMLDFYADWCVSCKEMERFTFSDPAIRAALNGYLLLQADVTANSEADQALLKRFKLFGPPGIIFFDAKGNELAAPRVVGFQNTEAFGRSLALVPR